MQLPPTEKRHLPLPEDLFGSDEAPRSKRKYTKRNASGNGPSRSSGGFDADDQIRTGLARYYMIAGMFLSRADPSGYDSTVVLAMSSTVADQWLAVGHDNPRVYQMLKMATFDSPIFNLAFAHVAILVAVGANHGVLPQNWPAAFDLPVPNPAVNQAAQAQMGSMDRPQQTDTRAPSPGPLDVPAFVPNGPRVDASATGLGFGPVDGIPTVQFDEQQLMAQIQQQAAQAALAQQAQAAAQESQNVTGIPGYNPADSAPRVNQNPKILSQLTRRM